MTDSSVMETVEPPTITETPLTLSDRCDRCNAAAAVRAVVNNIPLHFCRHHGNEYMPVLVERTTDIYVSPLDA